MLPVVVHVNPEQAAPTVVACQRNMQLWQVAALHKGLILVNAAMAVIWPPRTRVALRQIGTSRQISSAFMGGPTQAQPDEYTERRSTAIICVASLCKEAC